MEEQWNIQLYKTLQGETPVNDFILSLELKAQAKVRNSINLLKSFGISVGSSHIKKLTGTQLWELRILGADSIRILYIAITGKTFLLLHGFKKKKDKTPSKEIRIAAERLDEFRSRG
ncbi:type II toxin-antitoxin system RelE/ParE family toxin [Candidatus Roizmanbacteria bacterium]|nr:type II toxin-antitoxin system RelE/ParE family toxin [Candidatus Roizmanbacteria bacterium]